MTSPNENYTSWTVGMRVQCVDISHWTVNPIHPELPIAGKIYTISFITISRGEVGIQVKEVPTNVIDGQGGLFQAKYFRPVVTRPTSIAIFNSILSNPHKKLPTRENA